MLNTFKSTIPKVLLAAAVVAAVGAARPAAAAVVTTGSLKWTDGTSEFFADVNPGAGDLLTVNFSGLPSGSTPFAYIEQQASGVFVPPFTGVPFTLASLTGPAVGNFLWDSGSATSGFYKLTSDLAFNFANGISITWGTGTSFSYDFPSIDSVQLQVTPSAQPTITGLSGPDVIHTDALQFNDSSDLATSGIYGGSVDVSVPAPLPLLGAGVAFGFSRRLRKRIKLSAAV